MLLIFLFFLVLLLGEYSYNINTKNLNIRNFTVIKVNKRCLLLLFSIFLLLLLSLTSRERLYLILLYTIIYSFLYILIFYMTFKRRCDAIINIISRFSSLVSFLVALLNLIFSSYIISFLIDDITRVTEVSYNNFSLVQGVILFLSIIIFTFMLFIALLLVMTLLFEIFVFFIEFGIKRKIFNILLDDKSRVFKYRYKKTKLSTVLGIQLLFIASFVFLFSKVESSIDYVINENPDFLVKHLLYEYSYTSIPERCNNLDKENEKIIFVDFDTVSVVRKLENNYIFRLDHCTNKK